MEGSKRHTSAIDFVFDVLKVSESRKNTVIDEITHGSTPQATYYILIFIATFIASVGLVASSPAVVIGAMLVSPLMTPIFGISLGLVQGDISLLQKALKAEIGGVILAIFASALFGLLPLEFEVTPEMLARTQPTLLDLLVAALAGLAGCLAMIDERISPVLPGIAISTSLLPPLSTSGLCLALGAYAGAYGSFLLFFANFLGILFVASGVFLAARFVTRKEPDQKRAFIRRFLVAGIGLLLVIVLLTHALVGIIKERNLTKNIRETVHHEIANEAATSLEKIIHQPQHDRINILATVKTPRVFTPDKVKSIQEKLSQKLNRQTNLILRCEISKSISSTGSTSAVMRENLNGEFVTADLRPTVWKVQMAEQALREILIPYEMIFLNHVELLHFPFGQVLVASLEGTRSLTPYEVEKFQHQIRKRLKDPSLCLLVESTDRVAVTEKGHVLYGGAHFGAYTREGRALQGQIENLTRKDIEELGNLFPTNVDALNREGEWYVRAEVVGPKPLTPSEVAEVERRVSKAVRSQINLHILFRSEIVVTKKEYLSVQGFTERAIRKRDLDAQ